eukprot:CAMPEP_0174257140 /NCGR_PEP_ID=MMETSP0439-20130205/6298_1 /TAXON_ID=0 /ORGANISM="Stereomyxa ramosa, Strain Chinc5" /LENGTH=515 /DNA_ID=CAMNT_0015340081 /DNA_START=34 /DNA_END=1578 /DNA_ORIENTATION=-
MAWTFYVVLFALCLSVRSFYLPGVYPTYYEHGEPISVSVNKMTSIHTQLPYRFYDLPFCQPANGKIVDERENLGEILMGDIIESSAYTLYANSTTDCTLACGKRKYTPKEIKKFIDKISEDYRVNMIADNLPVATRKALASADRKMRVVYEAGFPLGEIGSSNNKMFAHLNNHLDFTVQYHEDPAAPGFYYVVAFEVVPRSIDHDLDDSKWGLKHYPDTCTEPNPRPLTITENEGKEVLWTYSVSWKYSPIRWASRWDIYLKMRDDQIHWFSIINSVMIVLFLTGMVAMIMMRTLRADFRRYREMQDSDDAQEETGWKLVHGDVFRAPNKPMLLSTSVGTGVQVFLMCMSTMVFAVLGFLSPANRGALIYAMLVSMVVMGICSGYFSLRLYKMFKGKHWLRATLMTALFYPGIAFSIFFILNLFILGQKSSGAVPFLSLLQIIVLWFVVSLALVFVSAHFGFKKSFKPPVRVNQIPRQIPDQVWYMQPLFSILMGGILPFGAIFIELFFILSSIW